MKATKSSKYFVIAIGSCALSTTPLMAQFDCGSNGSYGAMNITSSTNLDVPPDGVFNCTTINIGGGTVSLSFNRNGLNTPIYLLAQSHVTISARIVVAGGNSSDWNPGRGGPGGFDGGFGAVQSYQASDGQGPGGGKVGANYYGAVFGTALSDNTNVYGNTLLSPLIGGSGGAGNSGGNSGGGGGGAILIASNTRITLNQNGNFNEEIAANGGNGSASQGSGGAVRLIAPVVTGNGRINVNGGNGTASGAGRVRIDTLDRYAWRTLSLGNGKSSVGEQMYVFPPNNPHLDIVEAAGQAITVGVTNRILISLVPGTPTNQAVKVQATGFTNNVPVTVSVVPESGPSAQFNGTIAVSSTNATVGTVNVVIPADSFCNLSVWTR